LFEINASNTKWVNAYPTPESMSILNPESKPQSHKADKSQSGPDIEWIRFLISFIGQDLQDYGDVFRLRRAALRPFI